MFIKNVFYKLNFWLQLQLSSEYFGSVLIAAAVSEPEASERGSSLIGVSQYSKGAKNLISFKRKALWSISGQDALRFRPRFRKWRLSIHCTHDWERHDAPISTWL